MDDTEVANFWNGNADAWTQLARAGYDLYRDLVNTPAFFAMLPSVRGLRGLDIGCGEGHNTRRLADAGSHLAAIDIAARFIDHATAWEAREPRGIRYQVASASALPFADDSFDFAVAFMCFMDVPHVERAFAEALRVLRPGGFLQFSIEHPSYKTRHRRNLRDADGKSYAIEVGGYFEPLRGDVEEWIFGAAPEHVKAGLRRFRVPRFTRTLSEWLNLLIDTGFVIERLEEPRPSDATVQEHPYVQDAQVVPYFLHVRVRKPTPEAAVRK